MVLILYKLDGMEFFKVSNLLTLLYKNNNQFYNNDAFINNIIEYLWNNVNKIITNISTGYYYYTEAQLNAFQKAIELICLLKDKYY